MKTRIFKYIAVVALLFMAIPMQGQNYLKLWFKDGHTERHFMHLVKSISATKYDLEGNLHSDYQMQQIIMEDTTYSYYIADIDSMSFKKVDEEQVKNNIVNVTSLIDPVFEQSETFEEMQQHLNEIQNIEGVEDVELIGNGIAVTIHDWHNIFYIFPPDPISIENMSSTSKKNIARAKSKKQSKTYNIQKEARPVKVVVANQHYNDEKFKSIEDESAFLEEIFSDDLGYSYKFINTNFGLDFYRSGMFDYDIVIILTHGLYSEKAGKHWLLTGREAAEPSGWIDKLDNFSVYDDMETVGVACVKDKRGDKIVSTWYQAASEEYIGESSFSFDEDKRTIIFMGACKSLKGNNTLKRNFTYDPQEIKGDDSMAQIFLSKGADVYLGYENDAVHGHLAPYGFFYNLMKGFSVEYALSFLDSKLLNEESCWENQYKPAHLIDILKSSEYKGLFIVDTKTVKKSQAEVESEFKSTGEVTLKGITTTVEPTIGILPHGFLVSTDGNSFETYFCEFEAYGEEMREDNVTFEYIIKPEPGQTIYYRAFTYDGNANVGEIYSFTTPEASTPYHDLCPDGNHPHMIDLGLPSGTKWSCCNVGASVPTAYGNYYAWGETSTKSTYTKENYKYHHTDSDGKYVYDDATFTMAPTPDQVKELFANCTATETSVDGVAGEKLTSKKNGKKIFLPYGGAKGNSTVGVGEEYQYWTSQLEKSASNSKLLAPRQYSDNETDDLGNPYAFDWYEKDFRYIGKTVRKASK